MAFRATDESQGHTSKLSTSHTQRTGGPTVDRVRKEQLKGGLFASAPKALHRQEEDEEEEALGKLTASSSVGGPKVGKTDRTAAESISDAELAESLKLLEQLGSGASVSAGTRPAETQTKPKNESRPPPAVRSAPSASASLGQAKETQPDWSKLETATASKAPATLKPLPVTAGRNDDEDDEEVEALPGLSFQKPQAAVSKPLSSSVASTSRIAAPSVPISSKGDNTQKPQPAPAMVQLHAPKPVREDDEEEEEAEEGEEDTDDIQFIPKSQRGLAEGEKMTALRQSILASKQMALGFATNERKVVSLDQVSGASAIDDTDRPNDIVEWEAFVARRKERETRLKGILHP